jgi:hypothetical protein
MTLICLPFVGNKVWSVYFCLGQVCLYQKVPKAVYGSPGPRGHQLLHPPWESQEIESTGGWMARSLIPTKATKHIDNSEGAFSRWKVWDSFYIPEHPLQCSPDLKGVCGWWHDSENEKFLGDSNRRTKILGKSWVTVDISWLWGHRLTAASPTCKMINFNQVFKAPGFKKDNKI